MLLRAVLATRRTGMLAWDLRVVLRAGVLGACFMIRNSVIFLDDVVVVLTVPRRLLVRLVGSLRNIGPCALVTSLVRHLRTGQAILAVRVRVSREA